MYAYFARLARGLFTTNSSRPSPPSRRYARRLESLEPRTLMAADVATEYSVSNAWNSGFQAEIRLENQRPATISSWLLEFDLAADITSLWNGQIANRQGNHYTVVGSPWNQSLPNGGAVEFGFVAKSTGAPPEPTNYRFNGQPLDDNAPSLPTMSIEDAVLNEGNSGAVDAAIWVNLSAASATPVYVRYATSPGTAQATSDYTSASGILTFAPGETRRALRIPILGDTAVEADETFYVDLSQPSGALLGQARAKVTLRNDDAASSTGDVRFQTLSDWGSGFTGQINLHNSGAATTRWQLSFDFAGQITSIWDARIVSHAGNRYMVENEHYNGALAAGANVSFGFVASPGGGAARPTNFSFSAGGGTGNPTPTNRAPTAGADTANTTPGAPVTISVLANDADPDGDTLRVALLTQPTSGTATLNADQTIRYAPRAGFLGADSFTYQLSDGRGETATGTVRVTVAERTAMPRQVFAPYVDMTLYPQYNLVTAAQTQGLRHFTLAFIVADPLGKPAWGGYSEYGLGTQFDQQVKTQIAGLRALGGDVIVSFGGAANRELAEVITSVPALTRAYQSIIDAYGLTQIDFDVEGAAAADRASVDRRNAAIAALQHDAAAAGRTLDVSYTLPVLPSGLTHDGLAILQSAAQAGVDLSIVNIMAMDYGDSAVPNPQGRMGDYAIEAARSLFGQLRTLYGTTKPDAELWAMIGVTPMIGLNDVTTEVFDQQEARELVTFAELQGLGRLAMWSLNRDQQSSAGRLNWVDNTSSSLLQSPFEFSQILSQIED